MIEGGPIDSGDGTGVIDGLHPAFDLQAVDPGFDKFRQPVQQTEVARVKDIGSPFVLLDRKELSRPLFLDQVVVVTAGMGAVSLVGTAAGQVTTQQASAGVGDAYGAVNEYFYFKVGGFFDLTDLG